MRWSSQDEAGGTDDICSKGKWATSAGPGPDIPNPNWKVPLLSDQGPDVDVVQHL